VDSSNPKAPPIPQPVRRTVRRAAAYDALRELHECGEDVFEAIGRRSEAAPHREATIMNRLLEAPPSETRPLTSNDVAGILRYRVRLADYMVKVTPDPCASVVDKRLIPAPPIRDALREAGYSVEGKPRRNPVHTHAYLATQTDLHRRKIARICEGAKASLSLDEGDAIVRAIGRNDLHAELVEPLIEQRKALDLWIEEELEPIYEHLWFGMRNHLSSDERQALEDQHALYCDWQNSAALARLPFAERREATMERFRQVNSRLPLPMPDSFRRYALDILADRRKQYIAEANRAHKEIGDPERITGSYVRDLKRRARRRGFIDSTQRPVAFDAGRTRPMSKPRRLAWGTEGAEGRKRPLTVQERRLRQAERGMEREVAELRVLRTAPELEPDDPRRVVYEERHHTLAAKRIRRAEFRKREFMEIARRNNQSSAADS
jgi:hypothetical protein